MIRGVPYDAEVEYLGSNGNQFIKTGVPVVNALVGTEIKFQATATTNDRWVFGMFQNSAWNSHNYLIGSYSGWCVGLYGSFYRPGVSTDKEAHTVKININGRTSFDDVELLSSTVQKTSTTQYDVNAYLFGSHRNGSSPMGFSLPSRIFYCKMYRDGVLVRDFIPVRVGTEGAMYDRVSRKLFRNNGTGAFSYGPDVATPVMGLHFMRGGV